jgi:hypothetical protein
LRWSGIDGAGVTIAFSHGWFATWMYGVASTLFPHDLGRHANTSASELARSIDEHNCIKKKQKDPLLHIRDFKSKD